MSATLQTHQREQDYVLQRSEKFSPLHFLCKIEQIRGGVKHHAGIRLRKVNLIKSSVLRPPKRKRDWKQTAGGYKAPSNGLPRTYAPEQTFENGSGAKGLLK
jgi:hypothetical protein